MMLANREIPQDLSGRTVILTGGSRGIARDRDAEAAMGKVLDRNPSERRGKHSYTRNLLGVPPDELRARLARYQACFDVSSES